MSHRTVLVPIGCAVAIASYVATAPNELTLQPGDQVNILKKHPNGWWVCEHQGKVGNTPSNYLRSLTAATGASLPSTGPSHSAASSSYAQQQHFASAPSLQPVAHHRPAPTAPALAKPAFDGRKLQQLPAHHSSGQLPSSSSSASSLHPSSSSSSSFSTVHSTPSGYNASPAFVPSSMALDASHIRRGSGPPVRAAGGVLARGRGRGRGAVNSNSSSGQSLGGGSGGVGFARGSHAHRVRPASCIVPRQTAAQPQPHCSLSRGSALGAGFTPPSISRASKPTEPSFELPAVSRASKPLDSVAAAGVDAGGVEVPGVQRVSKPTVAQQSSLPMLRRYQTAPSPSVTSSASSSVASSNGRVHIPMGLPVASSSSSSTSTSTPSSFSSRSTSNASHTATNSSIERHPRTLPQPGSTTSTSTGQPPRRAPSNASLVRQPSATSAASTASGVRPRTVANLPQRRPAILPLQLSPRGGGDSSRDNRSTTSGEQARLQPQQRRRSMSLSPTPSAGSSSLATSSPPARMLSPRPMPKPPTFSSPPPTSTERVLSPGRSRLASKRGQSIPAPPKPAEKKPFDPVKARETKIQILREIVHTERAYLQSLNLLVNQYELPLRDLVQRKKMSLKVNVISELFDPVRMILEVNTPFLQTLERELQPFLDAPGNDEIPSFSKLLIQAATHFDVYGKYVVLYPDALEKMLALIEKKSKLRNFFQSAATSCAGLTVEALLIMPIQRIPRYILLLRELAKNTSEDDPEFALLDGATECVKKVADLLNEAKRAAERHEELIEIDKATFDPKIPNLVLRGRFLVKRGPVQQIERNRKDVCDRIMFAFNDMLVICSENTGLIGSSVTYVPEMRWSVSDINMCFPTDIMTWGLPKDVYQRMSAAFHVQTPYEVVTFLAADRDSKDEWVDTLLPHVSPGMKAPTL